MTIIMLGIAAIFLLFPVMQIVAIGITFPLMLNRIRGWLEKPQRWPLWLLGGGLVAIFILTGAVWNASLAGLLFRIAFILLWGGLSTAAALIINSNGEMR